MSRCKEFYDKWEKEPNWCEKCEDSVKKINNYIDLVNDLEDRGVPKSNTIVGLSEGSARPLFSIKDPIIKEKVIEAVKESLKTKKDVVKNRFTNGKLKTKDVKNIISKIIKDSKPEAKKLPDNKYNVILADPPWKYDFSSTENREIENQYPTMEIEDICKINIPSANDCILFLWATAPKLREALKVIDSWGFEYKTHAIWDKQKIGMGYYFRGQHELLLIATKGNPGTPSPETRPSSIFSSQRTEHSKKPVVVYEIIEKMYPNRSYLEMFARETREGWFPWGNEV